MRPANAYVIAMKANSKRIGVLVFVPGEWYLWRLTSRLSIDVNDVAEISRFSFELGLGVGAYSSSKPLTLRDARTLLNQAVNAADMEVAGVFKIDPQTFATMSRDELVERSVEAAAEQRAARRGASRELA